MKGVPPMETIAIIILGILSNFGVATSGVRYYIGFGMFRVSVVSLLMFYIPIYGAILYKYRNGGREAFFISLICHKKYLLK